MTASIIESTQAGPAAAGGAFKKTVVGVEAGKLSLETARQAAALTDPDGKLTLLATYQSLAAVPAWGAYAMAYELPEVTKMLKEQALGDLAQAKQAVSGTAPGELIEAATQDEAAAKSLVDYAAQHDCQLVAVDAPAHGRVFGIVAGDTATHVLHKATCSILVARRPLTGGLHSILVGIDGSPESSRALGVARQLAERRHANLTVLAAYGGGYQLDLDAVEALEPGYTSSAYDPVAALVSRAGEHDLIVVGSRGLKGLKALGSVSERVAHEAPCSVLVVR